MDFSKIVLDKNSKTALYQQLKGKILAAIHKGELQPGDLLPSESALANTLGVSVSTVRQCMGELANESYVEKRRNRGTKVLNRKINIGYSNDIVNFSERVKAMGMVPQTKLLKLTVENCPAHVLEKLEMDEGIKIIHLSRLRFIDGIPIVYIDSYLPYEQDRFILGNDLEMNSLYELLDKETDSRIDHLTRTVYATEASAETAQLFDIENGAAMLTVETLAYNQDGQLREYSISHSPGSRNQYTFTIHRKTI